MIKTELRRVKSFVQGDSVNFNLSLLRVGLNNFAEVIGIQIQKTE